jgi:spore maturation protein CgeB
MQLSEIINSYAADIRSGQLLMEAADIPHASNPQGNPTVSFEGRRLHSAVDPLHEAREWVEFYAEQIDAVLEHENAPIIVLLLGPGLGYGISALESYLRERQVDLRLLTVQCVEACPEVAKKALQLCVWEPSLLKVTWQIVSESDTSANRQNSERNSLVLHGTADYQLRRNEYEAFLNNQRNVAGESIPLRVLVPTPLYGGSLPAAYHSASALTHLGYEVELMDMSKYYSQFESANDLTKSESHRKVLKGLYTTYLAESIVARAIDWKADIVWAVAQTPLTPSALRELTHAGIHSALWFVEDFRLFEYWKEVAPLYDVVFTIQKGEFHERLRSLGVHNYFYLPCAANPEIHYPENPTPQDRARYGSQLSFVGAGYFNRAHTFAAIQNPDFKIWGNDWPSQQVGRHRVQEEGRRVSTDETRRIFNSSSININLHSSPVHTDVNPEGDFVNPRTFEIAACGAFQLVDHRSLLSELFDLEDEQVTFKSGEELRSLIGKFSNDEVGRRKYAERARARVLSDHTYEKRMETAVNHMLAVLPDLRKRKHSGNFLEFLIAAVQDDAEMVEYLKRMNPATTTDLDAIASTIELGKGKLSRPEGIFLLMKEFRDWGIEKGVIS